MTSSNSRPKWWQLYLLFPILIGLFLLEHRLKISARGHEVVQIGILVLVYSLIYWWLKSNSVALSREDQRNYGKVTVLQVPNAQDIAHSLFKLPDSEIKGMLSDTFEMDYIDAASFPVDEVPQESKKE